MVTFESFRIACCNETGTDKKHHFSCETTGRITLSERILRDQLKGLEIHIGTDKFDCEKRASSPCRSP